MENKDTSFFVRVDLTPEQARVIVEALDLFCRCHIGQLHTVRELFFGRLKDRDEVERVEALLNQVKAIVFPELDPRMGHSHGIAGCPSRAGKVAWDVLQVVRQCEALGRNPDGGFSVAFNDPLFVSDSVPRPKAKRITILDKLADI